MTLRKSISKKTRFELFKRDSFACQYCGQSAPEVILEPDHINPVHNGGDNNLMNLVTSCFDCNRGKAGNLLSDKSVIKKQRKQLEELTERRNQLAMMLQWRDSLKSIKDDEANIVAHAWHEATNGHSSLNSTGLDSAKKLIQKFGISAVLDAIETSRTSYISKINWEDENSNFHAGSAWHKVGGICKISSKPEAERRLYYIRGILRNRVAYVNESIVMRILKNALDAGVEVDDVENAAKQCRSWSAFTSELYLMTDEAEKNG